MIKSMTLEDKARLLSAASDWTTAALPKYGIRSIKLSDGPSGLRTIIDEDKGVVDQAVCYPSPSTLANSWNTQLAYDVANCVAGEAKSKGVDIVLAPGVNIQRSPLCGRNFEYYSEDPVLAGEMGAAYVKGLQNGGVGACLKHFAVNSQESYRAIVSSEVDERTLHEIYLKPFQIVIDKADPYTVMSAYNKVNGVYASENKTLLTDILRDKWGYKGAVISDWGAVNDRVQALKNGLDIEFPSSNGYNMRRIISAYNSGDITMDEIDIAVERVLQLYSKCEQALTQDITLTQEQIIDISARTSRNAALESIVLLKNQDNVLPLKSKVATLVMGELAQSPSIQGRGSSRVLPYTVTTALDGMKNLGINYIYEQGYRASADKPEFDLTETAYKAAKEYEQVILFLGLSEGAETEGVDRQDMDLPENQYKLAETVLELNPNTVLVIQSGAPIDLGRIKTAKAIVYQGLSGSYGDTVCDILFGEANPCGKLAQSFPLSVKDNPSYSYYAVGNNSVHYKETIYVGYRYYETYNKETAFCFGHGLSYTEFDYTELDIISGSKAGENLVVELTVTNIGKRAGNEIVQIYVLPNGDKGINLAAKELKGFAKVSLNKGESVKVKIDCGKDAFSYYNTVNKSWESVGGAYQVLAGASVQDIRLSVGLEVDITTKQPNDYGIDYSRFYITDDDFEKLLRKKPAELSYVPKKPFDLNSTLNDMCVTMVGRKIRQILFKQIVKQTHGAMTGEDFMTMGIADVPLRMLANNSQGKLSYETCDALLDMVNGKGIFGVGKLMKTINKK